MKIGKDIPVEQLENGAVAGVFENVRAQEASQQRNEAIAMVLGSSQREKGTKTAEDIEPKSGTKVFKF